MALQQSVLQAKLVKNSSSPQAAPIAAKNMAKAICDYWSMGMSNLGGKANASAALGPLSAALISATAAPSPSLDITAQAISNAISTAALSIIISGGTHGMGGVTAAPPVNLTKGLKKAMKSAKDPVSGAKTMAEAIHKFSTTDIKIWGTGVPQPFIQPAPNLQ